MPEASEGFNFKLTHDPIETFAPASVEWIGIATLTAMRHD
jgi:hypothetical protein